MGEINETKKMNKEYRYLLGCEPPINVINLKEHKVNKLFKYSCYLGYITLAKYLHDNVTLKMNEREYETLFKKVCVKGQQEIAEWLFNLSGFYSGHHGPLCVTYPLYDTFEICCKIGQFDMVKWLYSLNYLDPPWLAKAVGIFCENNHLEMAKWAYESCRKNGINIKVDCIFRNCYLDSNIEVLKWLYSLGGVKLHAYNDRIFRHACEWGEIEVAKWLYGLDGKINALIDNGYAFKKSLQRGNLEVSAWIYSLGGISIREIDNGIFRIDTGFGFSGIGRTIDGKGSFYDSDEEYY